MENMETEPFLVAFHRRFPGATARAFALGRADGGGTTYDLLADAAAGAGRVLDLGCGDGFLPQVLAERSPGALLVGVDIAEADVERARARALPNAEFLVARAQALPLPDASFDVVLSHMTLMLMHEIEDVLAEVARVLRPGGTFVGLVGTHPNTADAWGLYVSVFRELFDEHGTGWFNPGDERVRDDGPFAELLSGTFEAVDVRPVFVDLSGSLDDVWSFLSLSYLRSLVTDEGHAELERRFRERAPTLIGDDGRVPCSLRLLRFEGTRA